MSIFKVRYTTTPGHAICYLYVSPRPKETWAKCGEFTMRLLEFEEFKRTFKSEFEHFSRGEMMIEHLYGETRIT